jgi:predicted DNA-binding transcriptional regulator YafY
MTDDELLGQAVATASTSVPGLDVSAGAKPTTRKLMASSPAESAKLLKDAIAFAQALDLKAADHSQSHEIIGTVQRALIAGKQLEGRYQSPYRAKPVKLALSPVRLCFIKQAWYLIGRPNDGEAIKSYRIARFKALRMTGTEAVVPPCYAVYAVSTAAGE